ncbi:dihydroneopterin aldolase [Allorhizobium terrae]|uniref:7,8-dihydroneopterin aldolase n=1 Tax=Allorhizobium terrae TaxID=1848972 RepID=A0A4S4A6F0_9HYPH|nr:dihydroneopterin aldolase [Allorhizobium terrae]THF54123.1 dihydroneopterin aldolase [Allorhizobium terrae]TWD57990.1 dihydroneopterin aldolase [Agrobacterium vitis]
MADVYKITLKNCGFFARHGFHEQEEFLGQRFFVDAELEVLFSEALETDELSGTVDYGVAFNVIEEIVTGKRRYLIEALALDIAKSLCARFEPIVRAKITVRKPSAPITGMLDYVEVSVDHHR